jgi:fructosamine-3-kinase
VCAAEDDAAAWVSEHAGAGAVRGRAALGSSDWATSVRLDTDSGASFFVKTSSRDADMFTGEAWGLRAMGATATLRVPHVLHSGALPSGRGSFIVMEHLQLRGSADQAVLGRQLALMHAVRLLCATCMCSADAACWGPPGATTVQ